MKILYFAYMIEKNYLILATISTMKILVFFFLSLIIPFTFSFSFEGFKSANLSLDGIAQITHNGLLMLANSNQPRQIAHAFHPSPFMFKNSQNGSVVSFSTYFVFAFVPLQQDVPGPGMAFVIAPTLGIPGSHNQQLLGLFNDSNNGNFSNHILAVEIDMLQNLDAQDIDGHHVGIDINGMVSQNVSTLGYYDDHNGSLQNLTLGDGVPAQIWIEYDGDSTLLNVTLAPLHLEKPYTPLLSVPCDLSPILNQNMYVGFSAGSFLTTQYVLGWSFELNGIANTLSISRLPKLPRIGPKKISKLLIYVPLISIALLIVGVISLAYYIRKRLKFSELVEAWEVDYIPQRYKYKDLYNATKGFKDKELLGIGGFGKVYRGVMPNSRTEIAVKKISHESRQGMREFIAEIASMGRLRHRNLVALMGYCRRKKELILVYEYMPNGSLDRYLHNNPKSTLNWDQRFRIIKGVASGLLYLHEEWEQVVIHRDIKAGNVLLDMDFNAKLGDFGLARLYDRGADPQTTHVVGTLGYLAPEHSRTGKATTASDVFGFGAFLLEVVCGRRPVEQRNASEPAVLIDWILCLWTKGEIIESVDEKLGGDYDKDEVQLVLELGLLCSLSNPEMRPSMRQIIVYLSGEATLPDLSSLGVGANDMGMGYPSYNNKEGFEGYKSSDAFTTQTHGTFSGSLSVSNSMLRSGR